MNNKRFFLILTALAVSLAHADRIEISQDRTNALYACGEEATFTVRVTDAAGALRTSGSATWTLDNFGTTKIAAGTNDLAQANPFIVCGALNEPDFLKLTVKSSTNSLVWGVGYDVEKIRQTAACPADFDAYWTAEKARLEREVPLDVEMTPYLLPKHPTHEAWRVSFATFRGQRVHGFLAVPRDRTKAPFRVLVEVPGAGPGACGPWRIEPDAITLIMNVHLFNPAETGEKQKKLVDERNAALSKEFGFKESVYCARIGIGVSRELYHFHDVMLGMNRAVDWVMKRDDVDPTRVSYHGSSQGGGFGLFLNYLNDHFTRAAVAVCAITGHYGLDQNRQPGWPDLIASQPTDAAKANARAFAGYFDGVNFAARIRHPIRFLVSFADVTCPPANVYSAYNVCPSADKAILHAIGSGHSWTKWYAAHKGQRGCPDLSAWLAFQP